MRLSEEDKQMLQALCEQHDVSYEKVLRLLDTVKQFKDRRRGIYDALREIIGTDMTGR